MYRRECVGVIGTAALTVISGCGSDSSGGQSSQREANTPPPTATQAPARFRVVEYNIPETIELGERATIEMTVRNIGESTGDFGATLYARTPDREWEQLHYWTANAVPAGDTVTMKKAADGITKFIQSDYIRQIEFRLGESSYTAAIQIVPGQLSWGEQYTTPEGYVITIGQPTLQDTYDYEEFTGDIEQAEPDTGGQWAFVNAYVKNNTGQTEFSPLGSDFALIYGNSQADSEIILARDPINKGDEFEGGELQPGIERSGWIPYQVSNSVSVNDLTVAWSKTTFDGEIAVNWG